MRLRRVAGALLYASAVLVASAGVSPAEGQVRLHGRVTTEVEGIPIEGADVHLTTTRGRRLGSAVTDASGRFVFFVRGHTAIKLEASRLGYAAATTPTLFFDNYDIYQVEIRLDPDVTMLAPLEVRARSSTFFASGIIAGFEHRRLSAPGVFFTREDMERLRPGSVTDVLGTVPGVHLVSSGAGRRRGIEMTRAGRTCPVQVFIDGFLMSRDQEFAIDDAVTPQAIHGIEVYRGPSTIPADFLTPSSACGVVVIWTRRSD